MLKVHIDLKVIRVQCLLPKLLPSKFALYVKIYHNIIFCNCSSAFGADKLAHYFSN